jgi:hypothetical protein
MLRRLSPVCHFRQRNKLAGQFILQKSDLPGLAAYSNLSGAAFSAHRLLTLKTKHICHYATSIDITE